MIPPKTNLGWRYGRSFAILLSILSLIPAASSGMTDSSGGFLQTGLVLTNFDLDGKSVSCTASSYTFDGHGRVVTATSTTVFNSFQLRTNLDTSTYTYDNTGNLVLITQDSDNGADGTIDYQTITTISNLSRYLTVVVSSTESVADGMVENSSIETETFDERQRLIRSETEVDLNNDGSADYGYVVTWNYDLENHRIYQVQEADWTGDGVVDETVRTTYVTDNRGNVISFEANNQFGSFSDTGTFSYDKFGNLLQVVFEAGEPTHLVISSTVAISYSHRGDLIRDSNPGAATRALPRPDSWQSNATGVRSFPFPYLR